MWISMWFRLFANGDESESIIQQMRVWWIESYGEFVGAFASPSTRPPFDGEECQHTLDQYFLEVRRVPRGWYNQRTLLALP